MLLFYLLACVQVVTIGVVGGSDLVKISEQLGKTGTVQLFLYPFIVNFGRRQCFPLAYVAIVVRGFLCMTFVISLMNVQTGIA